MCATNDTVTLLDIFASAYERAGGTHLDITPADAMLVYLGVYTQDSILDVASSIAIDRLGRIWRELVMENRPEDVRRLEPKVLFAGGVDILLTHAPARGVGNLDDRPHQGFACFNEAIGAGAARFLTPRP